MTDAHHQVKVTLIYFQQSICLERKIYRDTFIVQSSSSLHCVCPPWLPLPHLHHPGEDHTLTVRGHALVQTLVCSARVVDDDVSWVTIIS